MKNHFTYYNVKIICLILLLPYVVLLRSQETPPINNFTPNIYQAENQNWDISQNEDKFIYIANNEGLLEFNGSDWTLYPSPNKTIIRSVESIAKRIYVGSYMEFGFWEKNGQGVLKYQSLSANIAKDLIEDEHFWNIEHYGHWVLFQSYSRIYIFDSRTDEINYLNDKNGYYRIFKVQNDIYLHKRNENLYKLEGGQEKLWVELPKSFEIELVLNVFTNGDEFTILTRHQGMFKVKNGNVTKWKLPAQNELSQIKVFCGIQLKNKDIVIGTISNGLLLLDQHGNLKNKISQRNGLGNNTVLDLFEDVEGNIWTALDNGIACLNMTSYIKEYNNLEGAIGTVYTSIVHNQFLYLGTNQGLFYRPLNSLAPFTLLNGTGGQVWSLAVHDNELLCSHTNGVYAVDEFNNAKQISFLNGTWGIKQIPGHPELLLQGQYSGLSVLGKDRNGNWAFKNKIDGFENSARFFEIVPDNEIWVNHEYKGVYRLQLDPDFEKINVVELLPNVPKAKNSGLLKVQDKLLYAYNEGVFSINHTNNQVVKDSNLSKLIPKNQYLSGKLVFDQKSRLWAFNKEYLAYSEEGIVSEEHLIHTIPIEDQWRNTTANFENIGLIKDNTYLVGKTDGYILLDLDHINNRQHSIFLNSIALVSNGAIKQRLTISEAGELKSKQNSLVFRFGVPRFQKYEDVLFQYQLEGSSANWSSWSRSAMAKFDHLPFGEYRFNVKSKIGEQLSENIASYHFVIARPFYASNLAILGYFLLLSLFIYIVHKSYNRYYKKQHLKMVLENQRQLEMNRIQARQEITRLKNEKLNQEIDSKNRELAISTMSMLSRNDVLKGIKKELKKSDLSNRKDVFKLIDKNLNSSKDWEFFKEAFDNSDQEFLSRIRKRHPKLTHNDLKFCAYLRLNLSSKEIAPLLNITVKSIEIRRYRLRKKMNLPHKTNLTDYILEV